MARAIQLARLGAGSTSPNPQVGAVLVDHQQIIGEGYHHRWGEAHAEVMAVRSVPEPLRKRIPHSTLYVSLEPCCVHGRTPPCTDLIRHVGIKRVVISCLDESPGIQGQGVALLEASGVEVISGVLQEEGRLLAAPRNTFVREHRPYVILKSAMSRDGYVGRPGGQVQLSHDFSWRLVHRIRYQVDGILIGTGTALADDPQLTNRLFWGKDPIRIVLDRRNRLHGQLQLICQGPQTLIYHHPDTPPTYPIGPHVTTVATPFASADPIGPILNDLARRNITTLLVEGGPQILASFLEHQFWDEALIASTPHYLGDGIPFPGGVRNPEHTFSLLGDEYGWFRRSS